MAQRHFFFLLTLTFVATPAFAMLQGGDLKIGEEGGTVYINGDQGAKLHLEYIGAPLTAPLKVRITPDVSDLTLSGATCNFRKRGDVCEPTLRLTNTRNKVYGVHQLIVTEMEGAGSSSSTGNAAISPPITFGVGLVEKGAPAPIQWYTFARISGSSPLVVVNGTQSHRLYKGIIEPGERGVSTTKEFRLPGGTSCYLDINSLPLSNTSRYQAVPHYWLSHHGWFNEGIYRGSSIVDITDPNHPVMNDAYSTATNNLSTCAANGLENCFSNLSASMSVGLANIGAEDKTDGSDAISASEVQVISDNRWDKSSPNKPGSIIHWREGWASSSMALLQIQGSTDGSAFDVKKAAPTALQIKAAPPCSSFIPK